MYRVRAGIAMGVRAGRFAPLKRIAPTGHSRKFLLAAGGALGVLTLTGTKVANDALRPMLKPEPAGDTYEMSIYMASQKELQRDKDLERELEARSVVSVLYKLKNLVKEYVWDNLILVARLLEITTIFLPVMVVYPISWFGSSRNEFKERYGSILWYKLLRYSVEMAGLTFIKLGQWAASRTDIFPLAMCHELGNLHSNAKLHSMRLTRKIICATFGVENFDDIFLEFDETPLGVGAIAQVYKLKFQPKMQGPQGYVAIKVLHPNVGIKIERDLKIMNFFANLINVIPTMEWLSLPQEVEQFAFLMRLQLDLRIESLNLQKFLGNFHAKPDIKFPKPYLNFTGREVLVEEYIQGVGISKFLKMTNSDNKILIDMSDKILDSFLQMLILDNFIHADLHPGNILINFKRENEYYDLTDLRKLDSTDELNQKLNQLQDQGYHAEICYIDAGLVTELNETDRVNFIELFNALSEFDGYRAGELMIERSRTPDTVISNEIFALKVERLVDRIKERTFTLGNLSIGDLLDQVLGMVRHHHVRMEGDFITVIVAILLLEGIGRQLDPNLDLFARFVYAWNFGFPTY